MLKLEAMGAGWEAQKAFEKEIKAKNRISLILMVSIVTIYAGFAIVMTCKAKDDNEPTF